MPKKKFSSYAYIKLSEAASDWENGFSNFNLFQSYSLDSGDTRQDKSPTHPRKTCCIKLDK